MKRTLFRMIIAAMVLVAGTTSAHAQLGKILSGAGSILGSATTQSGTSQSGGLISALTTIFDSNKTASVDELSGGTWKYTEPAIVFESNSALQNIGGKAVSSAIEKKLQQQLEKYGIKKGTMTMAFTKDGKFTQTIGTKKLTGTYTVDGKNVVLKYGGTTKQLIGTTQVDGNSLLIVTDATKLLSYVKLLGNLSGSTSLKAATSLLGSMKGMEVGFRLQK